MLGNERQKEILQWLRRTGTASVTVLATRLYASEATIRRDLIALEGQGLIRRVHGGAVLMEGNESQIPLFLREREQHAEKAHIAALAAAQVHDGSTVILDASSTVFHMVPLLEPFENLTVITNSPKTAMALAERHIRSYCTGGRLLDNSLAFIGSHAERLIGEIHADMVFFSCRGLSDEGRLSDSSPEETGIRRVMLAHATKRFCLCDSNKLGHDYLHTLCHAQELDAVFCDRPLPF